MNHSNLLQIYNHLKFKEPKKKVGVYLQTTYFFIIKKEKKETKKRWRKYQ